MKRPVSLQSCLIMLSLCLVAQSLQAEDIAKAQEKRSSFAKKITARKVGLVALGVWCCGVTYLCFKMQQSQKDAEKKIEHEREMRKKIEETVLSLVAFKKECSSQRDQIFQIDATLQEFKQRVKILEGSVTTVSRDLNAIMCALYGGVVISEEQKAYRRQVLGALLQGQEEDQAEVMGSDDESAPDSSIVQENEGNDELRTNTASTSGGWWPFGSK